MLERSGNPDYSGKRPCFIADIYSVWDKEALINKNQSHTIYLHMHYQIRSNLKSYVPDSTEIVTH